MNFELLLTIFQSYFRSILPFLPFVAAILSFYCLFLYCKHFFRHFFMLILSHKISYITSEMHWSWCTDENCSVFASVNCYHRAADAKDYKKRVLLHTIFQRFRWYFTALHFCFIRAKSVRVCGSKSQLFLLFTITQKLLRHSVIVTKTGSNMLKGHSKRDS